MILVLDPIALMVGVIALVVLALGLAVALRRGVLRGFFSNPHGQGGIVLDLRPHEEGVHPGWRYPNGPVTAARPSTTSNRPPAMVARR